MRKIKTLNMLPDGTPSPVYRCTAVCHRNIDNKEETVSKDLREWWYEGRKVSSIEDSARDYFYGRFDKHAFELRSIELVV